MEIGDDKAISLVPCALDDIQYTVDQGPLNRLNGIDMVKKSLTYPILWLPLSWTCSLIIKRKPNGSGLNVEFSYRCRYNERRDNEARRIVKTGLEIEIKGMRNIL